MQFVRTCLAAALLLPLAACHSGGQSGVPGDSTSNEPFSAIAASEVLRFVGTEPFWGGELKADTLTFTSPGNPQGVDIAVKRFGGRNGIGLSGTFDGKAVDMTITPGACSDGMSDRQFPFTVMLKLGGETRQGCAWSDAHPFTGDSQP